MDEADQQAADLERLHAVLYREKILRARRLTVAERLTEAFELSNHQFGMMLAGAMHRLGTRDEAAGWQEVARWMERLDRVREHRLYTAVKPGKS